MAVVRRNSSRQEDKQGLSRKKKDCGFEVGETNGVVPARDAGGCGSCKM